MVEVAIEAIIMSVAILGFVILMIISTYKNEINFLKRERDRLKRELKIYTKREENCKFEKHLVKKYNLKEIEEIEKDNQKLVTPYGLATRDEKGFYILPNSEKFYKVLEKDLKGELND